MKDLDCVHFLQQVLPELRLRWPGFRRVRRQVCRRLRSRLKEQQQLAQQQRLLEVQQKQIEAQQQEIEELKAARRARLLCEAERDAAICQVLQQLDVTEVPPPGCQGGAVLPPRPQAVARPRPQGSVGFPDPKVGAGNFPATTTSSSAPKGKERQIAIKVIHLPSGGKLYQTLWGQLQRYQRSSGVS